MRSSELRVGMVSVDSPPHIGGIGRHVGSLLKGLQEAGVSISLFDRTKRPLSYRLGRNIGFSYGLAGRLRDWITHERINLLHVHAGPGGVFLPFPPIPMIVTANHTYAQQSRLPWQRWKSVFRSAEWTTYVSALAVACISEDTAISLRNDYRIAPERVRTIPCGFDLAPWMLADTPKRNHRSCVFVGRADSRKGFDLLVEAWKIVRASVGDAELTVLGVRRTDMPGIRFLGRVPDDVLMRLVGSARLLIMPSRMEGFGLSAAEAISAGTPVVGTDVPGLRTVVSHQKTGVLTSVHPQAIAENVTHLLRDDAAWSLLQSGCRAERAKFSLEREVRAYQSLYDEVYSLAA